MRLAVPVPFNACGAEYCTDTSTKPLSRSHPILTCDFPPSRQERGVAAADGGAARLALHGADFGAVGHDGGGRGLAARGHPRGRAHGHSKGDLRNN